MNKPEILAPAGSRESFMAALAAGADAVYLGFKNFSARMLADNFSLPELASLTELAHSEERRVYLALNTVLKPDELARAGSVVASLAKLPAEAQPDALIVQDPGTLTLARMAGYDGEIHLSTLANVTHPAGLKAAAKLGASRVILPRELSIDEIKMLDQACPQGLSLELFVHGALCFCVSGRCYWSSYMGGKSGLRGQCVQPCRRVYTQRSKTSTFFSCLDLSLDVLVKTLLPIANLKSWKIEGRRKGPHYVYYVTTAYRLLRDNPSDPLVKKDVEKLLEMSLGRAGTKARFLPQNTKEPTVAHSCGEETASGLFMGRLTLGPGQGGQAGRKSDTLSKGPLSKGASSKHEARRGSGPRLAPDIDCLVLKPRQPLLGGDYLRVGNEDNPWHFTFTVRRAVPKAGALSVQVPRGKKPPSGAPVFLLDRREPELTAALHDWESKASKFKVASVKNVDFKPKFEPLPMARDELSGEGQNDSQNTGQNTGPNTGKVKQSKLKSGSGKSLNTCLEIELSNIVPQGRDNRRTLRSGFSQGLWLTRKTLDEVSRPLMDKISWWLPPVIWPDEEAQWQRIVLQAVKRGARHFVCNAPWQAALFAGEASTFNSATEQASAAKSEEFSHLQGKERSGVRAMPARTNQADVQLIAGPFCNITNQMTLLGLQRLGFKAAIVSPELSAEDMLALPGQSPLPLGVLLSGFWPVGISRHSFAGGKLNEAFVSPKREVFWARHYGQNLWIYPGWPLDISPAKEQLQAAGYKIFVNIKESLPREVPEPQRSSPFNWELGLL